MNKYQKGINKGVKMVIERKDSNMLSKSYLKARRDYKIMLSVLDNLIKQNKKKR